MQLKGPILPQFKKQRAGKQLDDYGGRCLYMREER